MTVPAEEGTPVLLRFLPDRADQLQEVHVSDGLRLIKLHLFQKPDLECTLSLTNR